MKNIIIASLFLLASLNSKAGYDVMFCSSLDSSGRCIGKAEEFKWTGDKMPVYTIVLNKDGILTAKLNFKVFLMKNSHDGELAAELSVYPKPKASSAVKKMFYFKPGYYKVDVYDADNKLLTSAYITISER